MVQEKSLRNLLNRINLKLINSGLFATAIGIPHELLTTQILIWHTRSVARRRAIFVQVRRSIFYFSEVGASARMRAFGGRLLEDEYSDQGC